jgi:hypothetical protein
MVSARTHQHNDDYHRGSFSHGNSSSFETPFIGSLSVKYNLVKVTTDGRGIEQWALYARELGPVDSFGPSEALDVLNQSQKNQLPTPKFIYNVPLLNPDSIDSCTYVPFVPQGSRIDPDLRQIHDEVSAKYCDAYALHSGKLAEAVILFKAGDQTNAKQDTQQTKGRSKIRGALPVVAALAAIGFAYSRSLPAEISTEQKPVVSYNPNITKQQIKTAFSKINPVDRAAELMKITPAEFKRYCLATNDNRFKTKVFTMIQELPNEVYNKHAADLENLRYVYTRFGQPDVHRTYSPAPQARGYVVTDPFQRASQDQSEAYEAAPSIDPSALLERAGSEVKNSIQNGKEALLDEASNAVTEKAQDALWSVMTNQYVLGSLASVFVLAGLYVRNRINAGKKLLSYLLPGNKKS